MRFAACLAALCVLVFAADADALQVRFYPSGPLYTYELDAAHGASSLVVHNIAVINDGAAPVTLSEVQIELRAGGRTLDLRTLGVPELTRAAAGGARMQQAGMIGGLRFLFGGENLMPAGTQLSQTPTLAPGEALIVNWQVFGFRGARDEIRVRALGADAQGEASLPISNGASQTVFDFPMHGAWYAAGPTPHSTHRWGPMEQFAFDLVQRGADNKTHRRDGLRFRDYYGYGKPVLAAAAGTVVAAVDGVAEDPTAIRQPNETLEAYMTRLQGEQMQRIAGGANAVIGNHVILDHGKGEFSVYAHLKPGSVRAHVGDRVATGAEIGAVGSSGNSTEPHLHFQVCNSADPLMCAAIPVHWRGLDFGIDDAPRAPQSGDFLSQAPS